VTNALGQPGIAVAWGNGTAGSYEWIFNPVTYQFIGEQNSGISLSPATSLTLNCKVH
jgi:hypothetical protein